MSTIETKMKYFAAIFQLTSGQDHAVIVKALDKEDAFSLVKNYTGELKVIIPVINPSEHMPEITAKGLGNVYDLGRKKH